MTQETTETKEPRRPPLSELTAVHVDDEVLAEIRKHAAKMGLASWNDVLRDAFCLPVAPWAAGSAATAGRE